MEGQDSLSIDIQGFLIHAAITWRAALEKKVPTVGSELPTLRQLVAIIASWSGYNFWVYNGRWVAGVGALYVMKFDPMFDPLNRRHGSDFMLVEL
eukprot:scaffold142401_cov47-Attheya_sp.AAC.1